MHCTVPGFPMGDGDLNLGSHVCAAGPVHPNLSPWPYSCYYIIGLKGYVLIIQGYKTNLGQNENEYKLCLINALLCFDYFHF